MEPKKADEWMEKCADVFLAKPGVLIMGKLGEGRDGGGHALIPSEADRDYDDNWIEIHPNRVYSEEASHFNYAHLTANPHSALASFDPQWELFLSAVPSDK